MIFFALKLQTPKTPLREGLVAIDWLGTITIVGAVLMFLLGLDFGGVTQPWSSAEVLCLIIFGGVLFALFLLTQWKISRYPIMPLELFRKLSNLAALSATFFQGIVFIGAAFYLPLYFQSVLGAKPLLSGVYFLPFCLAIALSSAGTGIYIEKTGRYVECVIFGFFFMTLGFGLLINLPDDRQWAKIIIYQILAGMGSGPNFQAPLVALQTGMRQRDIATTTATFNFVRNIATAIGVVLGTVVFNNQLADKGASLRASIGNSAAHLLTGGDAVANVFVVDTLPSDRKAIARHALWKSLQTVWIVYTALAAAGHVGSFFVRRRHLSEQTERVQIGLEGEEEKRQAAKERRLARTGKSAGVKDDSQV